MQWPVGLEPSTGPGGLGPRPPVGPQGPAGYLQSGPCVAGGHLVTRGDRRRSHSRKPRGSGTAPQARQTSGMEAFLVATLLVQGELQSPESFPYEETREPLSRACLEYVESLQVTRGELPTRWGARLTRGAGCSSGRASDGGQRHGGFIPHGTGTAGPTENAHWPRWCPVQAPSSGAELAPTAPAAPAPSTPPGPLRPPALPGPRLAQTLVLRGSPEGWAVGRAGGSIAPSTAGGRAEARPGRLPAVPHPTLQEGG